MDIVNFKSTVLAQLSNNFLRAVFQNKYFYTNIHLYFRLQVIKLPSKSSYIIQLPKTNITPTLLEQAILLNYVLGPKRGRVHESNH